MYALARALVMIAKKFGIFPNVQLARKYARIYALIYASCTQALSIFKNINREQKMINKIGDGEKCS
jgi:hypothetical protein